MKVGPEHRGDFFFFVFRAGEFNIGHSSLSNAVLTSARMFSVKDLYVSGSDSDKSSRFFHMAGSFRISSDDKPSCLRAGELPER